MTTGEYQEFTKALVARLERDQRVIGLVAVGSMAHRDYLPDEWSDHDFFVIVENGNQEWFRANFDWLPQNDRIVHSFRETPHGVKVLYDTGHLLEFAVFDIAELHLARINRYRVLLDRGQVESHLFQLAEETKKSFAVADDKWEFGQFLTNLLVGVGRHQRGEKLSGAWFVKTSALRHFIALIRKHIASEHTELLDNLDELRRFEVGYPEIGKQLNSALLLDTPAAALKLLMLSEDLLKTRIAGYPSAAVETVKKQIAR